MKKQSNLGLAASLICAAGSLWFALTELFSKEEAAVRRLSRCLLWMTAAGVWTANLVMQLLEIKAELSAEPDYIEEIEEDDFYD